MGFLDRNMKDSAHNLEGLYYQFDFETETLSQLPVKFFFATRSGFAETVVQPINDLQANSGATTIETYANLPFRPQDVIKLENGAEYRISNVNVESDESVFRKGLKQRYTRAKKIIFME